LLSAYAKDSAPVCSQLNSRVMQFKMFHRPKPKQFSYQPIYYDPQKQDKQAEKIAENDFRTKFREETDKNSNKSAGRKSVNISIYIIIIVLLIYFIFFS